MLDPMTESIVLSKPLCFLYFTSLKRINSKYIDGVVQENILLIQQE